MKPKQKSKPDKQDAAARGRFRRVQRVGRVSIYQRNGHYYLFYHQAGKFIRQKFQGEGRMEAMRKAGEISDLLKGKKRIPGSEPLGERLEQYLSAEKLNLASETFRDKKTILNEMLGADGINALRLEDVSAEAVENYLIRQRGDERAEKNREKYRRMNAEQGWKPREVRKTAPWSARTANKARGYLRHFFAWAIRMGFAAQNPADQVRRQVGAPKKERRALSEAEIEKLLAAARPPWRFVFEFLLATGLRINELVTLTTQNLDLDAGEIRIEARNTKKRREKVIPLHPSLIPELRTLRGQGSIISPPRVFRSPTGGPLVATNTLRAFAAAVKRAQIDPTGLDLHSLRVTFCTRLARARISPRVAADLMGHKTIQMTLAIYTKVAAEDKTEAILSLPIPLKKAPEKEPERAKPSRNPHKKPPRTPKNPEK